MPRVCADSCAFHVDAGSLMLNWDAVGSSYGQSRSGDIDLEPTGGTDRYEGPYGLQRLAYTNDTCRDRIVRYEAYVPRVDIEMSPGNWFLTALYARSKLGSPPSSSSFDEGEAAVFRVNNSSSSSGTVRRTAPLVGPASFEIVAPGDTLHMSAGLWKWIAAHSGDDGEMTAEHLQLTYQTWPST